jgi:hypothetical protein
MGGEAGDVFIVIHEGYLLLDCGLVTTKKYPELTLLK